MFNKPPLFSTDLDAVRRVRDLERPEARKSFVIFFTARSGSSWLTDICRETKRLSIPDECFNPGFMPTMTKAMNARNMDEYVAVMKRRRNTRGVFGCQLTYHQLRAVFADETQFMDYFRDARFLWLLREDIVLQGVSLMKMVKTNVGHTAHADAEARAASDAAFVYDTAEIKRWIIHNLAAERATEKMIERFGLSPLRLSYETITGAGAVATVNRIAAHVGIAPVATGPIESGHGKLATGKNAEFAARFREDAADFVAQMEEERAPWLAQVDRDWI